MRYFDSNAFRHLQQQYAFIHDALREYLLCPEHEIPSANFTSYIQRLRQPDADGVTGLQKQFEVSAHALLIRTISVLRLLAEDESSPSDFNASGCARKFATVKEVKQYFGVAHRGRATRD